MLQFERGSSNEPKGHALAYFRSAQDRDETYATYLVVPPIAIDLAKYMPPMIAGNIPLADIAASVSAVPLPPLPEKVALAEIRRLAENRGDDLLYLGEAHTADVQHMLGEVAEAAQAYLAVYAAFIGRTKPEATSAPELSGQVRSSLEAVLNDLMTDRERVAELAKLIGKLQYATQGRDGALEVEAVQEIEALGAQLGTKYQVPELLVAARTSGAKGQRLCELYLARCYKLCDEDYLGVGELERQIREAQVDLS